MKVMINDEDDDDDVVVVVLVGLVAMVARKGSG